MRKLPFRILKEKKRKEKILKNRKESLEFHWPGDGSLLLSFKQEPRAEKGPVWDRISELMPMNAVQRPVLNLDRGLERRNDAGTQAVVLTSSGPFLLLGRCAVNGQALREWLTDSLKSPQMTRASSLFIEFCHCRSSNCGLFQKGRGCLLHPPALSCVKFQFPILSKWLNEWNEHHNVKGRALSPGTIDREPTLSAFCPASVKW